jgi:hypothetical protein
LNAVRRALASVNPFAYQQIPTSERLGLNIKFGRKFYREEVLVYLVSLTPVKPISTINIQVIINLLMMKDLKKSQEPDTFI